MTKYVERLLTRKDDNVKQKDQENQIPLSGIRNVGNTCFMNSVLQSLSNTNQIRNYCYYNQLTINGKAGDRYVYQNSLLFAFIYFVNANWSQNYRIITPLAIKDILSDKYTQYRGKDRHDAHEFLLYLLNELRTYTITNNQLLLSHQLNKANQSKQPKNTMIRRNQSFSKVFSPTINGYESLSSQRLSKSDSSSLQIPIHNELETVDIIKVFEGTIQKQTQCNHCHSQYHQTEQFYSIPLTLPPWKSSQQHPISLESCLELYFGEEQIDDWQCEQCHIHQSIGRVTTQVKLPSVVIIHINRQLNSNQYLKYPLDELIIQQSPNQFVSYELYSCIHYQKNYLLKGHYITFNKVINTWYCCDDEHVFPMIPNTTSNTCYLLFYRMKM